MRPHTFGPYKKRKGNPKVYRTCVVCGIQETPALGPMRALAYRMPFAPWSIYMQPCVPKAGGQDE